VSIYRQISSTDEKDVGKGTDLLKDRDVECSEGPAIDRLESVGQAKSKKKKDAGKQPTLPGTTPCPPLLIALSQSSPIIEC
jgi:hypothetical protein